jgi:hypothetical protein
MKTIVVFCMFLIQMVPALQSAAPSRQQQKQRKAYADVNTLQKQHWRAGTYLGLTAGKSTKEEMLRAFGEPRRIDTPADQTPNDPHPEVWYVYNGGGEFAGQLTVVIDKRTNVILRINLNPESLSKDEAVKHFGSDYVLTRYNFDECLGGEESAPLYESANGPLREVEYRNRGIALSVNEDEKVNTISYVSKPIGTRESKCHPKKKRSRQKKTD